MPHHLMPIDDLRGADALGLDVGRAERTLSDLDRW